MAMMPYTKNMDEEESTKTKGKKPKLFSTMTRKPVFKQTLIIFFVLLLLYALFNTFFQPTDSSTFDSSTFSFNTATTSSAASKSPAVKVYLYDLPKRFTYGVIHHHSLARGSRANADEKDVTSLKYPGHQHMAEWYLFSDLSRPDSERTGSPVVRVSDPEEADLFFVPFFSSLSLIVNPVRPAGPEKNAYSDEENQDALMEWLEMQEFWKRSKGRDHVIVASDPNAMYRVVDRVKNCVLLVSDFGRLRPDQGSLVKDVIVPYSHRIRTYDGGVGVDKRDTLLFFMGNRYRKEVM